MSEIIKKYLYIEGKFYVDCALTNFSLLHYYTVKEVM